MKIFPKIHCNHYIYLPEGRKHKAINLKVPSLALSLWCEGKSEGVSLRGFALESKEKSSIRNVAQMQKHRCLAAGRKFHICLDRTASSPKG